MGFGASSIDTDAGSFGKERVRLRHPSDLGTPARGRLVALVAQQPETTAPATTLTNPGKQERYARRGHLRTRWNPEIST